MNPDRSYVSQSLNEYIDPFNGSLQLHYVDVHVPGNGGFDLQVTRSYNSAGVNESNPLAYFGAAGVGWTIHFGRVIFKATIGACGGSGFLNVLNDAVLELPDGSTQILAATGGTPAFLTTQRYRADCNASGITVFSPDGIRYDMTQPVALPQQGATAISAWYTTRIADRNGNSATIAYTGSASAEVANVVTARENHRIDFSYNALASGELTRRISAITSNDSAGAHVFQYIYQPVTGFAGAYNLVSVIRPGNTSWQYQYYGNRNATIPGGFLMSNLTYPEGGTTSYGYGSSSSQYVNFDPVNGLARTTVVRTKSTSDGGFWNFDYLVGVGGDDNTTTVNTPSGTVTYRHVGPSSVSSGSLWKVGLLTQKQSGGVQTETYGWTPQVISPQQFTRPGAWQATRVDSNMSAPVLSSKTITRDGASHTTLFSGFDSYGNPSTMTESGPNGGNRTTTLTYYYDTGRWIVKQLKNELASGGVQIVREFDGAGNVQSFSRDGVTTTYSYNADGTVQRATFPRSLVHNYSSYKRGIPQNETQPEGVSLSRTVSDHGDVTSETNGRGNRTGFGYDGLNRLTSITPPMGNATSISYGQTTKSASRGSLSEVTNYDGFGRPQSVTLGGISRSYSHDPLGRMTFASNPASGSGTNFQYDMFDRVSFVTNADGTNRAISFGPGSKTVRDERNYSTTYTFRAYGDPSHQFLMSVAAPDSVSSLDIQRNNGKDLVSSVTQGGVSRTYDYDGRGYLYLVTNPETGTTIYGRDDAGNMTTRSVGSAGTTNYSYDGQNRLYFESYPGATPSVTKTYTTTNKLKSVTSSVAARGYDYDANENLFLETLTTDGQSFSLVYGYNGLDQLSSLSYPQSNRYVVYAPDALGRPSQVSGFVSSVSYWPSGQVNQIGFVNGTSSVYGQNARLWPSSFQALKGASAYVSSTYTYDGLGNLKTISDGVDTSYNRTLDYDPVNRLTTAAGPWGAGNLTYDGIGNLKSQTFGSFGLTYSYSSNRLASLSGSRSASYSYDSYGNITSDGGKTFSYDGAPNMTCAICNDAAMAIQYQYDGLNRRVSVLKAAVKTYEFYDFNGNLLVEFTPALSNRLVEHIYLGGKRIATVGPSPTSISLPAQTLTAVAGQTVSFVATVSGGVSPTGTVAFTDGTAPLSSVPLSGGAATLTTTFTTVGTHSLTATYSGDTANFGSGVTAVVNVLSTTTISGPAGGSGLTAVAGKASPLSATINGISPTGTVSFYDGAVLLGTAALIGGTATINPTFTTTGDHAIRFVYSGDSRNAPSSATVTLRVLMRPEQLIPILDLLLN